jgi:hypothetical protein
MHLRRSLGQSKRGMNSKSVVSQTNIPINITCAICEEDVVDIYV